LDKHQSAEWEAVGSYPRGNSHMKGAGMLIGILNYTPKGD